jgi:hypothetical protein
VRFDSNGTPRPRFHFFCGCFRLYRRQSAHREGRRRHGYPRRQDTLTLKREVTATHTIPSAARDWRSALAAFGPSWDERCSSRQRRCIPRPLVLKVEDSGDAGPLSVGALRASLVIRRCARGRPRAGTGGGKRETAVSRLFPCIWTHGPPRLVRGLGTAPPALRCRRLQEHESGRRCLSLNWAQYNTSTQAKSRALHVIYLSVSSVVRRHPRSVCTIRFPSSSSSPPLHPIDLLPRAISKKSFHGPPPTTCCCRAWRWAAPIRYPDTADPRCHSEWKTM